MTSSDGRSRKFWSLWRRARWVLACTVVAGLAAHLFYSLQVIELPTYRGQLNFEFEELDGRQVAGMTPAELEAAMRIPHNGTSTHARYTNLTLPTQRTMHEAGGSTVVPRLLNGSLQVFSSSTVAFEVFLAGIPLTAGAGFGNFSYLLGSGFDFDEVRHLQVKLKNLGNDSRVDSRILVAFEDAKFFAPNAMRILLIHAPSAWVGYLGYAVALGGSLLALRRPKWETWAAAGIELSVLFSTIALVTGPLWASAEWLTPWRWEDVKLFVTLVMFLTLLGFLSIRGGIDDPAHRRRVSAYYAALAFVTVPLSFFANRLWPRDHPAVIENPQGEISDAILAQLMFGMFILTLLFLLLLLTRVELLQRRERAEDAKALLAESDEKLVADLPVVEEDGGEDEKSTGTVRDDGGGEG